MHTANIGGTEDTEHGSAHVAQPLDARAVLYGLVRRLNRELAPTHFLVAKYRRGVMVGYCLAKGDPMTARYDVIDTPVDLEETARRLGVRVTAAERRALGNRVAA
jgi:hypothetical protein